MVRFCTFNSAKPHSPLSVRTWPLAQVSSAAVGVGVRGQSLGLLQVLEVLPRGSHVTLARNQRPRLVGSEVGPTAPELQLNSFELPETTLEICDNPHAGFLGGRRVGDVSERMHPTGRRGRPRSQETGSGAVIMTASRSTSKRRGYINFRRPWITVNTANSMDLWK